MRYWKMVLLAPAMMIVAACNRGDERAAADSALNRDLSLASQVSPAQPIDSMEAGAAAVPSRSPRSLRSSRAPARSTSTTRRSTASRVETSSDGSVSSSGSGTTVVKKNTKRDAVIGAAAGAAIGAATSKDRLKGAVVGGVVGGVLGGVIGNNVDVQKKKTPN